MVTNELFTPQTSERRDSLLIRSARVSARTIPTTRGATVSTDSLSSPDGIPIGVLGRRENEAKWQIASKKWVRREKTRMKLLKHHPFCVLWLVSMLTLGAILQVTMHG